MNKNDELMKLVVKKDDVVNKKVLGEILSKYIMIGDDGEIIPEKNFFKQTEANKITIFLLANKAKFILGIGDMKQESVSSLEISKQTGVNSNHISEYVRRLDGLVKKDKNGYFVPNYNISRLEFLHDIPSNKKQTKSAPNKKEARISKGKASKSTPMKISGKSDIKLNEEQVKELKNRFHELKPNNGYKVVLIISNFIREVLKRENFTETDINHLYMIAISLGVKPPLIRHMKQTIQNLVSHSQKVMWLEKEGDLLYCSAGGIIFYTDMKQNKATE